MLIDDNTIDVFFNVRAIKKFDTSIIITEKRSVADALGYLEKLAVTEFPDVIFLDIAMPGYSGCDFLESYNKLYANQKTIITILTASHDPLDIACAEALQLPYKNKPLKVSMLNEIVDSQNGYASSMV